MGEPLTPPIRRWTSFEDEDHQVVVVAEGSGDYIAWPEMDEHDVSALIAEHNAVIVALDAARAAAPVGDDAEYEQRIREFWTTFVGAGTTRAVPPAPALLDSGGLDVERLERAMAAHATGHEDGLLAVSCHTDIAAEYARLREPAPVSAA